MCCLSDVRLLWNEVNSHDVFARSVIPNHSWRVEAQYLWRPAYRVDCRRARHIRTLLLTMVDMDQTAYFYLARLSQRRPTRARPACHYSPADLSMTSSIAVILQQGDSGLAPLTSSKTHDLAVLLQLGDQLIALFDHIVVPVRSFSNDRTLNRTFNNSLLILVIRSLSLYDTPHTIDRAWQSLRRNERRQVLVQPLH